MAVYIKACITTTDVMVTVVLVMGTLRRVVVRSNSGNGSGSGSSSSSRQQAAAVIDNRIYNSRLNSSHQLCRRKCHQFSRDKKWRTRRKTGCYWAEEYATSQLHKRN